MKMHPYAKAPGSVVQLMSDFVGGITESHALMARVFPSFRMSTKLTVIHMLRMAYTQGWNHGWAVANKKQPTTYIVPTKAQAKRRTSYVSLIPAGYEGDVRDNIQLVDENFTDLPKDVRDRMVCLLCSVHRHGRMTHA